MHTCTIRTRKALFFCHIYLASSVARLDQRHIAFVVMALPPISMFTQTPQPLSLSSSVTKFSIFNAAYRVAFYVRQPFYTKYNVRNSFLRVFYCKTHNLGKLQLQKLCDARTRFSPCSAHYSIIIPVAFSSSTQPIELHALFRNVVDAATILERMEVCSRNNIEGNRAI